MRLSHAPRDMRYIVSSVVQVWWSRVDAQRDRYSWLYAYRVTFLTDVLAIEDGDGAILPTWTAVDSNNVRTSRELWEYTRSQGWNVEVSTS